MSDILIVEDDPDISDLLVHYLKREGFTTRTVVTGTAALEAARLAQPDVMVLDLMLPELDGLQVCRAMRGDPKTAAVPIIMLTARAAEADRVAGLELGADDYVTKPFSPKEMVARIKAQIRRSRRNGGELAVITYESVRIDVERHQVTDDGREVHLTAKEFLLLQYLLQHRGRVLSRDLLLTDVWGYHYTGGTRTVDVHVRRLREKLPLLTEALVTVKQFGYKLRDPRDEPADSR